MCGICGLIGHDSKLLARMLDKIRHRGPDSIDSFNDSHVSLGHARLSIIDLDKRSNQPFLKDDYVIVYNGEVYNYLEIKSELEELGSSFTTTSDTEVVLESYIRYGSDCLKFFNGMFSFCIYDKKKQVLFLAVDQLGKKPLYYSQNANSFLFASEISSILVSDTFSVDETSIIDFFTYGYIPAPKTYYQKIARLKGGHYMNYDLLSNKLKILQYWNPIISSDYKSFKQIAKESHAILKDSVFKRLRADVPIELFLSAGLDSSSLALMIKNSNIKCRSINFSDGQEKLVKKFCLENSINLNLSKIEKYNYLDEVQKIVSHLKEPFADNSCVPTSIISRKAKTKVILTGDGGDEVFFGYKRYNLLKYYNNPIFVFLAKLLYPMSKKIPSFSKILYVLKQEKFENFYIRLIGGFTPEQQKYFLSSSFLKKHHGYNHYWLFDSLWDKSFSLSKKAQVFDVFSYLQNDILYKSDRISMKYGLEVRSPFLDYRFFELMLKINPDLLMKNGLKSVLKYIMKSKLPGYILSNGKRGFGFNSREICFESQSEVFNKDALSFFMKQKKMYYYNVMNGVIYD